MIRVLHSELTYRVGGIEAFLLNLTRCINKEEISFEFITKYENVALKEEFENCGCKIHKVPQDLIGYCREIRKIIKNGNYDIIHIHKNSAANIIFPLIVRYTGNAKIIIHSHNTMPSRPSKIKRMLHLMNRPVLNRVADLRWACSDVAAEWMYGKSGMNNIQIVKNGIITDNYKYDERIRATIRKSIDIGDKFVIGHVGRFTNQKNHKFLIDILAGLTDKNIIMILIGEGELQEEVRRYADEKGVSDSVKYLGQCSNVNELMQAMDVFVMPSLYEGLPVSCIEAQASGLPLLLSDTISTMCSITNNVQYISLDDIQAWCSAIENVKATFSRQDTGKEIIDAGYDMMSTAKLLSEFYFKTESQ